MISPPGWYLVTPPSVRRHLVFDAHVGEGAAGHYSIIPRREP